MAEFYLQYEYHITSAQLIFAMLGMGVTLRPAAFMEILRFPKGFALGLGSVLIVSPALALAIATLFELEPGIETSYRNISLALLVKASLWPARAGVGDPFADQVFFVVLFYGGIAMLTALPPLLIHRRIAAD